ncbi:MAG: hypothetical protein JSR37_06700 [Verrucomicrobia bacterium]|nr:hypothetical protein [Verrucomicrobiota bacterium]
MSIQNRALFDLKSSDLIALVEHETKNEGTYSTLSAHKPLSSLSLPVEEVQKIATSVLADIPIESEASILAARIRAGNFDFPYEKFDNKRLDGIIAHLMDSGAAVNRYAIAYSPNQVSIIPSQKLDGDKSHFVLSGKRWGANHNYGQLWRPFTLPDGTIAVIDTPSGQNAPGRFIDHCTTERLKSSCSSTGYISPLEGWKSHLDKVAIKVVRTICYEHIKCKNEEVPYKAHPETDAIFRNACIAVFPCSFHFPPTALHGTIAFTETISQELFRNGIRMLDPSAGHGHRLAGALACKKIVFMQATDPNRGMLAGYKNIFNEIASRAPDLDATLNLIADESITLGSGSRAFTIVQGKAEDSLNRIYSTDLPYNLIFSSPPFFDTEAYGDPEGQSIQSFSTFDRWKEGFLAPMLKNCWDKLAPGGILALNLTDTASHKVVEALVAIVTENLQGEYLGVIPCKKMVGSSRWQPFQQREVDVGVDPIWIFKKHEL